MKGRNNNQQLQEQITISAYEMEVIQKSFKNVLRWTEFLMSEIHKENPGVYSNWKRQISETIERKDLKNSKEIKGFMETALLALDGLDKPEFILINIQEQFYSWLEKSGIRVDDCPLELTECLVNIEKVLNREGKEFAERLDRKTEEDIAKMTPEERRKNFNQTFTIAQKLMNTAKKRQEDLEGQTWKDTQKNQFLGDSEQGQLIFAQIKSAYENRPQLINNPWKQNGRELLIREDGRNTIQYDWDEGNNADEDLSEKEKDSAEKLIVERQKELKNKSGNDAELWSIGSGFVVLIVSLRFWIFKKKLGFSKKV